MGTIHSSLSNINYDTGWLTATLKSGYSHYSDTEKLLYRRIGKLVEINGCVKNDSTVSMTDYNDLFQVATIPVGFRPSVTITKVNQTTGYYKLLTYVDSAGNIGFTAYSLDGTLPSSITSGK